MGQGETNMERIYLDNGSTCFPKAPGVGAAMAAFIDHVGVNIGRGGYQEAYSASELVLDTQERLCRLFGASKPENVVFTAGITTSLNMILKGFLKPGDHVITSAMEHNAVMRPLRQLEQHGVELSLIPCREDGTLCLECLPDLIRPNTKLVVMLHASNVCGTIMPIQEVAQLCRREGIRFVVDSAQTGGLVPLEMENWGIDALAFAGHKGLLGPQGIGGFLIADDFVPLVEPLISGGTGSISHLETVPDFMPDRFTCGTQNLPGIFGLHAALCYLEQVGTEAIRSHEMACTRQLIDGFLALGGVRVVGLTEPEGRTAAVSVDFQTMDNAQAAFLLEDRFGIMTRCGLHCAPAAHLSLHTFPHGTVRFTPGYTTTSEEIEKTLDAVRTLLPG